MRRRWIGLSAITAAAAAVAFAGWFPYYRLEREVSAARAEGLWTELSDIPRGIASAAPKGENAANLVRKTIAEGKATGLRYRELSADADKLLKRTATAAEKARLQSTILVHRHILRSWRKASACARLDFGRDWKLGYATMFPELADLKLASSLLASAAALGMQPKENLVAAARLTCLTRQEPNIIAHLVSVSMGRVALKEAKRQGLGPEVEKALGKPLDMRWAYAGELPCALDTMRRVGSPRWFKDLGVQDNRDFLERIRNTGPWKANAAYRLVHDYRQLWRELPKETENYDVAIRAIDRWVPKINDEISGASSVMGKLMATSTDVSEFVKSFKKFEAERQSSAHP